MLGKRQEIQSLATYIAIRTPNSRENCLDTFCLHEICFLVQTYISGQKVVRPDNYVIVLAITCWQITVFIILRPLLVLCDPSNIMLI